MSTTSTERITESHTSQLERVRIEVDPKRVVQPSFTRFRNRLGGRVAVMAVNLKDCVSPNLFSFAKRDLIARLLIDLGGEEAIPARVIDRANVTLLANEDAGQTRLMLHLVNLSCDTADGVEFEVGNRHAGRRVEVLSGSEWRDADAKWDGRRFRVRASVPVYGTLVLRLVK